ncbi:MAG: hypothetical protein IKH27_09490 [Oscillospiraceae bacterium]|nr:hypothetical protein [Oscillospiraceae bacterium]
MKKHFLTIMTAVAAAAMLTGCGTGTTAKNGTYISVNGIRNQADAYRTDPDAALDAVLAEEIESEAAVTLNQNQTLSILRHYAANNAVTWNGTYSTEGSKLIFNYTGAEADSNADRFTAKIADLNSTGAYPDSLMPRIYLTDAASAFSRLPVGILRSKEADAPSEASLHGDFICTPMFGMTADGKYETGKDFALNYVPADTLKNDPYSTAYYNVQDKTYLQELDAEKLDLELSLLANRYGLENSDNMQFRVSFSGGKWEMAEADGSAFSHGAYAESKKHPGFISMYEEPDDPQTAARLGSFYPLFLYIDGNGVYYPGLVRKP